MEEVRSKQEVTTNRSIGARWLLAADRSEPEVPRRLDLVVGELGVVGPVPNNPHHHLRGRVRLCDATTADQVTCQDRGEVGGALKEVRGDEVEGCTECSLVRSDDSLEPLLNQLRA